MKKSWKTFRETGLLLFVNMFLHIFGWAIVIKEDEYTKEILDIYPCKVSCKGFKEKDVKDAYKRLEEVIRNEKA